MNNKTTNIPKKYQPIIARLFVIAIIALAWAFVTPAKTLAVENNSPGVPDYLNLTNFYGSPPCNRDHAQANWISPTTNSAIYGTYNLATGQDSLSLRVNTVAAVCDQNTFFGNIIRKNLSQTSTVYMRAITTNTPGITTSGISLNSSTQLYYNCMNFWNLRFAKVCPSGLAGADYYNTPVNLPFTVSGFNSLAPGTYNITLSAEVKLLNTFDGPAYQCVGDREQYVDNYLLFGQCTSNFPTYTITVVKPAPNYLGQIQTLKYDTATGVLATDQSMKNARTYIEPCGGSATCSNVGLNNWLTGVYMWVYQGGPGFGNGVQNIHSSKIDVPYGYRVNKVRLNLNTSPVTDVTPTTTADGKLTCTDTNNTGTCSIGTKVWNNNTTFVDWFLEKITPTLNVTCTSDNLTTGGYITVTASSNIPGGTNTVAIKGDTDINPPATPQNITGSYTFDITSKYRDGGTHTYYATYDGLSKSVTFGPGQTCNIDKWFYPWLQTSQGDVVADGKIEGQTTSTGTAGTLGARLDNATAKEAEFLVISAVADGGPFCSTYKYILTNTSSQGTNCGNGAGYNFNSTGIDNDTVDRVIGGVKQAFADNGNNANSAPSACSANGISTATVTQTPAVMSTTCTGGLIYKQSSNTLPPLMNLNKGKVTIFVEGDLTITGPILYTVRTDLYPVTDPRLVPTLAIVVTGDVDITSNTTQIDAQIYSKGTIRTCSKNPANTLAATPQDCSINRLIVNGSLSAKAGFDFRRTFISEASRTSAEFIKLTGNSIVIPPPGLDSRYFYNNFSSYKLDSAEYNPRF